MDGVKISLITTCKGRLEYLKRSIRTWLDLDYENYGIIVVDYDCPDGAGAYIERNRTALLKHSKATTLSVVKVADRPYFNLNDARNRGIRTADGELIFLVDADTLILDKTILSTVDRKYRMGFAFFSNMLVLNSDRFEGSILYKLGYECEIRHPCLLPTTASQPGMTGTSCFIRQLALECGGFKSSINRVGYGMDDREFYLRYLNFFYYHILCKGKRPTGPSLEKALERCYLFPEGTLVTVENSAEERQRYYRNTALVSNAKNKCFIREFFKNFAREVKLDPAAEEALLFAAGRGNRGRNGNGDCAESGGTAGNEGRRGASRLPFHGRWFRSWFNFWYGRELYSRGRLAECECYLRRVLRSRTISARALANVRLRLGEMAFRLGELAESSGRGNWRYWYRRAQEELLSQRGLSDLERYRLASITKKLGEYSKAQGMFLNLLKNRDMTRGALLHLGEMAYHLKDFRSARRFLHACVSGGTAASVKCSQ
jgi:glycosyltransferase involved in cell wall biosynthesis